MGLVETSAASATQQQTISAAFQSSSKYKTESKEQHTKEQAIARWIGRTVLPLTTIEDEDFVLMIEIVDRRLTVPKKTKISNLIETQYGLKDKNSKRDWLLPEEYPWALTCGQKKD